MQQLEYNYSFIYKNSQKYNQGKTSIKINLMNRINKQIMKEQKYANINSKESLQNQIRGHPQKSINHI